MAAGDPDAEATLAPPTLKTDARSGWPRWTAACATPIAVSAAAMPFLIVAHVRRTRPSRSVSYWLGGASIMRRRTS